MACAGVAILLASPVFGAESEKPKAAGGSGFAMAIPGTQSVLASTSGPNFIGNFALAGADVTAAGLPCFFCAPAPNGGYGVSLAIPLGYIPSSVTTLDYEYMFQDLTITGTCTLSYAVRQGSTIIQASAFPASLYPATWLVTFVAPNPGISGQATLNGIVICNGKTQSIVSTNLIFQ